MSYDKNEIWTELILTAGFGAAASYLMINGSFGKLLLASAEGQISSFGFALVTFYIYAAIIAGWYTIGKSLEIMKAPVISWIFLLPVKLALALWIGIVMLPIRFIKNIIRLKELA